MAIYEKFYTDKGGAQYRVALTYERDGRPRGYYLSIYPVDVEVMGGGLASVAYTMDAHFFQNRVYSCLKDVKRASKTAEKIALENMHAATDIYFAPRGIARIETLSEIIDEHEKRAAWAD